MKWVTSLLISCSLAVAGAVYAQQPDDQQTPAKDNKHAGKKNEQATSETQPGATNANPKHGHRADATGTQQQGQESQNRPVHQLNRGPQNGEKAGDQDNLNGRNGKTNTEERTGKVNAKERTGKMNTEERTGKVKTEERTGKVNTEERTGKVNAEERTGKVKAEERTTNESGRTGAVGTSNSTTNTNVNANVTTEERTNNTTVAGGAVVRGRGKKIEPQQVQQIRQQHASFRAQPRPDRVPAVTYNAGFRIQGAERWQGPQYEVYRSYHPERHDQGWYRQHYNRVELVGGGYYYWNNGYWYPAWGYDQGHEYYAYDGPIYVGQQAQPPDQVIADVQSELQQMGYYQGEVDGLLGPMTREALTAYQQDEGLMTTATIDEPTLGSLGMSS